jgi:hypothetical protein
MKKAKPVIAFIFLVVACASVAGIEYDLVMGFEMLSSLFASVFGLFVMLLVALFRAPDGYEDENGFHISVAAVGAPHMFAVSGFPSGRVGWRSMYGCAAAAHFLSARLAPFLL